MALGSVASDRELQWVQKSLGDGKIQRSRNFNVVYFAFNKVNGMMGGFYYGCIVCERFPISRSISRQ